jgi:hypothetical protein
MVPAVRRKSVSCAPWSNPNKTMNKTRLRLILICGVVFLAASSLAQTDGTIYDPETGDISFIQPGGTIYDPETGDISFIQPGGTIYDPETGDISFIQPDGTIFNPGDE